jgi:hypothetical protein
MMNFVESYENVLFGILGLLELWYLRGYFIATQKLRIGAYIVERETAIRDRNVSMSMLIVLSGAICMVYFGSRRILPAMSTILSVPKNPNEGAVMITKVPTITPDVVLLLPGQATPVLNKKLDTVTRVSTQVPIGGSGCDNKNAVIYSPLPGAVLSGEVEVQGTADIVDFAFYVLEISTLGDNWLTVHTQDIPVLSDVLGSWNASFYAQGEYGFRLVVYNAAGAYPVPCVIPIYIGSGP